MPLNLDRNEVDNLIPTTIAPYPYLEQETTATNLQSASNTTPLEHITYPDILHKIMLRISVLRSQKKIVPFLNQEMVDLILDLPKNEDSLEAENFVKDLLQLNAQDTIVEYDDIKESLSMIALNKGLYKIANLLIQDDCSKGNYKILRYKQTDKSKTVLEALRQNNIEQEKQCYCVIEDDTSHYATDEQENVSPPPSPRDSLLDEGQTQYPYCTSNDQHEPIDTEDNHPTTISQIPIARNTAMHNNPSIFIDLANESDDEPCLAGQNEAGTFACNLL